jgi:hypothetical protein
MSKSGFSKHPLLSANQILAVSGSLVSKWEAAVHGVSAKQYKHRSHLVCVFLPSMLTGVLNCLLSLMSITSRTDSERKSILLAIITPWGQLSLYLKKCERKILREMYFYQPPDAFFLFPVAWHWEYPLSIDLYRVIMASHRARFDGNLKTLFNDLTY